MLRGVENAVVAVEESCVLDVKSGTVLIISSSRVKILLPYKDALLDLASPNVPYKQRSESLHNRVVVLLKMYYSPCCFKLRISNAIKEVTHR